MNFDPNDPEGTLFYVRKVTRLVMRDMGCGSQIGIQDADDIAMEALTIFLEQKDKIREPRAYGKYIRTTVENLIKEHLRRENRPVIRLLQEIPSEQQSEEARHPFWDEIVTTAKAKLTEHDRSVFNSILDGVDDHSDVAQSLSRTVRAIDGSIARIKKSLHEASGDLCLRLNQRVFETLTKDSLDDLTTLARTRTEKVELRMGAMIMLRMYAEYLFFEYVEKTKYESDDNGVEEAHYLCSVSVFCLDEIENPTLPVPFDPLLIGKLKMAASSFYFWLFDLQCEPSHAKPTVDCFLDAVFHFSYIPDFDMTMIHAYWGGLVATLPRFIGPREFFSFIEQYQDVNKVSMPTWIQPVI